MNSQHFQNLMGRPAKSISCTKCSYTWKTRSHYRLVTCPGCVRKILNPWAKRQKTTTKTKTKTKTKPKARMKTKVRTR